MLSGRGQSARTGRCLHLWIVFILSPSPSQWDFVWGMRGRQGGGVGGKCFCVDSADWPVEFTHGGDLQTKPRRPCKQFTAEGLFSESLAEAYCRICLAAAAWYAARPHAPLSFGGGVGSGR